VQVRAIDGLIRFPTRAVTRMNSRRPPAGDDATFLSSRYSKSLSFSGNL
jgi:hypothetical protein